MNNVIIVDDYIKKQIKLEKTIWFKFEKAYWHVYRKIMRHIEPIYYNYFGYKHHIIKTELKPSAWYDSDSRILYGIMSVVRFYVEKDMMKISKEDFDNELHRIEKEEIHEHKQHQIDQWVHQYESQEEIIKIYNWWLNYNNRQKEINNALHEWHKAATIGQRHVLDFCTKDRLTPEQKIEEERLSKRLHDLEDTLMNEEQEMLKKVIDLRFKMWS